MFNQWIERIKAATETSLSQTNDADMLDDVARVSAALLVEVARADHQLETTEVQSITKALQQSSSLDDSEVEQIVNAAVVDADSAISLHDHVKLVNEQFDRDKKRMLIEQMWRVAAADGNIDRYEDYTIRKLSDLFHIPHAEFIQAKLRVIDA